MKMNASSESLAKAFEEKCKSRSQLVDEAAAEK
jgi:hypothetical protein